MWKFASCDGCQLTLLDVEDHLLDVAGAIDIAYFPEATTGEIEGRLRPLTGRRARSPPPMTPDGSRDVREMSKTVVTIGACATAGRDPGAAELGERRRVPEHRLCPSRVHRDPGDLHTDRRAHRSRFRAAWLPDIQVSAARGDRRLSPPAKAQHPAAQCLCRVQAARHQLRHGCPGHSLHGTDHPGGVWRHLPCLRPGLLRLLRALPIPKHRTRSPPGGNALEVTDVDLVRALRTFNAYSPEFREASEAYEH